MVDWSRLIAVYVGYGITIPIYSYLFYKILKRKKKNKVALSLNAYFFLAIFGFVLNLIYLPLQVNPIAAILYKISAFCVLFAVFFLPFALVNLDKELNFRKSLLLALLYIAIIILVLSIPNSIKYEQTTNWRPKYSWQFFIATYIYIIGGAIIPSIFLLWKLLKTIARDKLKRKIQIFFIGELLAMWLVLFGIVLANTWENETYRIIYSLISVPLAIINAWLIYYGLGKELD